MITQILLASNKKAKATYIGQASNSSNQSTHNFGDFYIPRKGILVAMGYAIGATAGLVSSVSIGGVNAALNITNPANELIRYFSASREVDAGTHNITVNLSSLLGGTPSANIGVYLVEDYDNSIPVGVDHNTIAAASTSISNDTDVLFDGVILYSHALSQGSYSGNVSYSSANLDYSGQSRAGRFYSYASLRYNGNQDTHSETATVTSSTNNSLLSVSFK